MMAHPPNKVDEKEAVAEYDWLVFKDNVEQDRKPNLLTRNPFVPIGVIATTLCLGFGLRSLLYGNRVLSQKMMRARVSAQGFTLAAVIAGLFYEANQ